MQLGATLMVALPSPLFLFIRNKNALELYLTCSDSKRFRPFLQHRQIIKKADRPSHPAHFDMFDHLMEVRAIDLREAVAHDKELFDICKQSEEVSVVVNYSEVGLKGALKVSSI